MDSRNIFAVRHYVFVFSVLFIFSIFFINPVQAAPLHTFAQYAKMTPDQQNKLRAKAASVVFKDALTRGDKKQVACLRRNFSSKYGPKLKVQISHAKLRGKLEAEVEIENKASKPDSRKRIEYLVGNHLLQICPRSPVKNVKY